MGGKGGGGGVDTSGMERATREATALQKQIYEETREDVQPWYRAGVGGIDKLSNLLGISGGAGQGRQQIYDELMPQYTSQAQRAVDPTGGQWVGYEGMVYPNEQAAKLSFTRAPDYGHTSTGSRPSYLGVTEEGISKRYWDPYQATPSGGGQDVTDYEALNAAVDARMSGQGTQEGYGSLLEQFDASKFEEDPGAEYRRSQAQKALERSMAAQGVTLGGGGLGTINPQVARALEEQQQGIASQEYGQAFDRYNIGQQNVYNRLMGVAGMGQGSTGQMAQGGQAYATNVGNLQTGLAGAQMQAQMAQQSQPSMFGSLLGAGAQFAGSYFSDIRLKENIKLVGAEMGHNIYEFDYADGSGRYRGVIAHEVEKIEPDAVIRMPSGYLMVNYDKIGLEMERV